MKIQILYCLQIYPFFMFFRMTQTADYGWGFEQVFAGNHLKSFRNNNHNQQLTIHLVIL